MNETPTSWAEQTAAALARDFPGLRQTEPTATGRPLHDVAIGPATRLLRYSWEDYAVVIEIGEPASLDADADTAGGFHRQLTAYATLLVTEVIDHQARGRVEWQRTNPRPQMLFPAAYVAAPEERDDPLFTSAVLAACGLALDYALTATARATRQGAQAQRVRAWERDRPADVSWRSWKRRKTAEAAEAADRTAE
jgi:hypothetical protein